MAMVEVDLDDIRRLEEMSARSPSFATTVAKVTLALLNDRFDAEYRAQSAEITSVNAVAKLTAIRDIVDGAHGWSFEDKLRAIAELL